MTAGGPDDIVFIEPDVHQRADWRWMADLTKSGSARLTDENPCRAATLAVSTRCAPLVRISRGWPSAAKMRLFAIAPTSQPSWAAAAAAVGAGSGSSLTSPVAPSDCRTPATRCALGCMAEGYRRALLTEPGRPGDSP